MWILNSMTIKSCSPLWVCVFMFVSRIIRASLVAQLVKHPPAMQELLLFAKSLQSCPTLCDPIDGSPLGSPVPGILQARTLEWVAISFSNAWKWKVKVKSLIRVRLSATLWTAAFQAPPSMGFSRQKYWSGVPLPSPTWVQMGWEDPLEKRKATHSRILAWRIPWTTVYGVAKSWARLSDFHFHFQGLLKVNCGNLKLIYRYAYSCQLQNKILLFNRAGWVAWRHCFRTCRCGRNWKFISLPLQE